MGKLLKNPLFAFRHAVITGCMAVVLAALSSLASQALMARITVIWLSIATLLVIIIVGIVFDIVGVAVAAASEPPLHARAARRIPGATHALHLVRRAHTVASFCNDVVGDVCGTLSGAIGMTIVYQLMQLRVAGTQSLWATVMTAIVAGLVVGGKAYGKAFAIEDGTQIVFHCGQMLFWVERVLHFKLFKSYPKTGSSSRKRQGRKRSQEKVKAS